MRGKILTDMIRGVRGLGTVQLQDGRVLRYTPAECEEHLPVDTIVEVQLLSGGQIYRMKRVFPIDSNLQGLVGPRGLPITGVLAEAAPPGREKVHFGQDPAHGGDQSQRARLFEWQTKASASTGLEPDDEQDQRFMFVMLD